MWVTRKWGRRAAEAQAPRKLKPIAVRGPQPAPAPVFTGAGRYE
jgi:hypothetical protein